MSGDKIPPIDYVTGKFVRPLSGNKVYKTESELTKGLLENEIPHQVYVELLEVYHIAYEEAPKYGYVGVGCISFAEKMLMGYQGYDTGKIKSPKMYTEEDFKNITYPFSIKESNDE
jgi:hypothetical protein